MNEYGWVVAFVVCILFIIAFTDVQVDFCIYLCF